MTADGTVGIEHVGAHPGKGAERHDDQERRRPDQDFELGRVVPVGRVGRGRVGGAVTPSEDGSRQRHHRQDDEQHQAGRGEDEVALLNRDIARRIHQHDRCSRRAGRRRGAAAEEAHKSHGRRGHLFGVPADLWMNPAQRGIGRFVQAPIGLDACRANAVCVLRRWTVSSGTMHSRDPAADGHRRDSGGLVGVGTRRQARVGRPA